MKPPLIDQRNLAALTEQMKRLVPYYTPEWRFSPEDPDPGSALFAVFADNFQQNINRLNRVPLKNYIAFLNLLHPTLYTAKPASAYLTFQLSSGAKDPVFIRQGTRVSGKSDDGDGDVLFETVSPIMVTPAELSAIYNVSPLQDKICLVQKGGSAMASQSSVLFDVGSQPNLQEHVWVLGDPAYFHVATRAQIELQLTNASQTYLEAPLLQRLADPSIVEWTYGNAEKGWLPFQDIKVSGNKLLLTKQGIDPIDEMEWEGKIGRWIQCRVRPGKIHEAVINGAAIGQVGIKTEWKPPVDGDMSNGIQLEAVYSNDIQADLTGMYAFGEQFYQNGTLYLSSGEVFSKRNATITLSFDVKAVEHRAYPVQERKVDWKLVMKASDFDEAKDEYIVVSQVIWEYWNGAGWVRLLADTQDEAVFGDPGRQLTKKKIVFTCPSDLEPTFVNSQQSHWIRARIIHISNEIYSTNSVYLSPWLENLRLHYEYEQYSRPELIYARNNMKLQQWEKGGAYPPFVPWKWKNPAVYLGFSTAPVKGPISIYFSIAKLKYVGDQLPALEWEYLSATAQGVKWVPLKVMDGTDGFTASGVIQFAGPTNFAHEALFGQTLYWIRVVNRDNKTERSGQPLPIVRGIFMNTACSLQQESIESEYPSRVAGDSGDSYVLSRAPVLSEQVWVEETGHITEEAIRLMELHQQEQIAVIRDSEGNVQKCWLRWEPVANLHHSGAADRHYVIDRTSGRFSFGDGRSGMAPPLPGEDKVKVSYKFGGGERGNLPAGTIKQLQHAIAFIQSVYNPEPSAGGSNRETIEEAQIRVPQLFKHRNRAVTTDDFEALAREAYPNLAKVKCLSNINANLDKESGCVTMVILPKGQRSEFIFAEMKRRVEHALLEKAASLVAFPEKLQVIEPAYIEISIYAAVAVHEMEHMYEVEVQTMDKLNRFLDPMTGNYDGKGWGIGQSINQSVFYSLIKSIPRVNYVEKLSMTVFRIEDDIRTELDAEHFEGVLHGIIINGNHHVEVNVV
ncbi:putative baseplate assembly protein [Paenibacillus allorhizosphaerae]|uniref:Baseplate assembly protein n=1 Tax=Paenibacillus allorhizosphaerae TaxID=2849866 RepID=A0ABM8VHN2_9BACL|nr:putative baseplate assembly protein [Paenibacillus allorhizosphaerae]CAG7640739.1 hypothetical protein PAECIP111802_02679 [Paenibacillus allorhizosphaerae]